MVTDLEPDIPECEVKWALGSISMNQARGGDRFIGKTIDVKGFVGVFGEDYQIEIYDINHITFHN